MAAELERKLAAASKKDAEREEADAKRQQTVEGELAAAQRKMQDTIEMQKQHFQMQFEEEKSRLVSAAKKDRALLESEKAELVVLAEREKARFEEQKTRFAAASRGERERESN
eukprot:CAMPEP_0179486362 /NCGR_PEP_ID=MMETSP0799-20121207/62691_1 /TAXON_ID=46947 /ORGANISM="Geminigera cryophila, Strain CCMP2564" /LENGTH=112 /DNA_ID=CAMNT_0021301095 /DNA_START=1 /DNA_END=339 /DNA_ORIENTATION=-